MKRIAIGALLAGAMLIPGAHAVSARQEHPAPTVDYVVQPGDTLWMIAGTVDADGDKRVVVERLLELNGMTSVAIHPGQRIKIPA